MIFFKFLQPRNVFTVFLFYLRFYFITSLIIVLPSLYFAMISICLQNSTSCKLATTSRRMTFWFYGCTKVVGLERVSDEGATNLEQFKSVFHGIVSNRGPKAAVIIAEKVVITKYHYLLSYS